MSKTVKLKINEEQLMLDKIHLLTDIILNIEYRNSIKKKNHLQSWFIVYLRLSSLWAITFTIHLSRSFLFNITTQ